MSMTIKQLADELGVSKTAVRKYLTQEFRERYVTTSETGAILVSDEGANQLKSFRKPPQTTANQLSETPETPVSDDVLRVLTAQLDAKDRQIAAQQEQIAQLTAALENTTESLKAAQALHAGTLQKQLALGDGSRKWWQFWKKGE